MVLHELICPHCGANIEIDNIKNTSVCQYCGSTFVINNNEQLSHYNKYENSHTDDILMSILDINEDSKFSEAKQALKNHDFSLCEEICKDIIYNINPKSRKTLELLIENQFQHHLGGDYNKCIRDIFANKYNAEKTFESFVENYENKYYIKRYLHDFNDSKSKFFILQFKEKIVHIYKKCNNKKICLKEFFDSTLSQNHFLKFDYFGSTDFSPYFLYLWKDSNYYYFTDSLRIDQFTPTNFFVFHFNSNNLELYKAFSATADHNKYSFWAGKYITTFNFLEIKTEKIIITPYSIDNFICINGRLYVVNNNLDDNQQKLLNDISINFKKGTQSYF